MSAYLVSAAHIDVLVDFARAVAGRGRENLRLPMPPRSYDIQFGDLQNGWWGESGHLFDPREFPDQLGRALWRANWDSVAYRYPGDADPSDPNGAALAAYKARPHPRLYCITPGTADQEAGMILKQLDCFDYQACEIPDYELTWAAAVIDALRRAAIRSLRSYDAAPWGV